MEAIEVFVDENNQPQHIAVLNEHKRCFDNEPTHRAVCGSDASTLSVRKRTYYGMKLPCHDCQEQLKMWLDVNTPSDVVR
jgi:hypothetical protein